MEPKEENYILVYLKPGELYAGSEPVVIKTVLGSCIAVCLHDKLHKVGGANHYLLPYSKDNENPFNYGEKSIPELIDAVLREGGEKRYLVAQIVGGCAQVGSVFDVGQSNIAIARKILQECSIPIIYEDVGGSFGRVITFHPYSNELNIRRAGSSSPAISVNKEESFVQLTSSQINFLTNMFSLGLQRARQSLATMFRVPVNIEVEEAILRPMGYVQEYAQRKFCEYVLSTGPKEPGTIGEVILIVDPARMAIFVNSLLKRNRQIQLQYDRMECSVILEFTNIVINAILGTLANHLGFNMVLRVPRLIRNQQEMSSLPFMNPARKWRMNLATKTRISIPDWQLETVLLLMVELYSTQRFFEKIRNC